jgi:large subunit ribosomal protein L25
LIVTEHDRISISAEALHLPDHLDASIDGLEAGSHVTAGDVKLPSGVELTADPALIIAVITTAPTAEQLGAELPEAVAEEAAAEEGEAAAEAETAA